MTTYDLCRLDPMVYILLEIRERAGVRYTSRPHWKNHVPFSCRTRVPLRGFIMLSMKRVVAALGFTHAGIPLYVSWMISVCVAVGLCRRM